MSGMPGIEPAQIGHGIVVPCRSGRPALQAPADTQAVHSPSVTSRCPMAKGAAKVTSWTGRSSGRPSTEPIRNAPAGTTIRVGHVGQSLKVVPGRGSATGAIATLQTGPSAPLRARPGPRRFWPRTGRGRPARRAGSPARSSEAAATRAPSQRRAPGSRRRTRWPTAPGTLGRPRGSAGYRLDLAGFGAGIRTLFGRSPAGHVGRRSKLRPNRVDRTGPAFGIDRHQRVDQVQQNGIVAAGTGAARRLQRIRSEPTQRVRGHDPGHRPVQDRAKGIEVGPRALLTANPVLLGRGVVRRHDLRDGGAMAESEVAGGTEIDEDRIAVAAEDDVPRLQVPMQNGLVVQHRQPIDDAVEDLPDLGSGSGASTRTSSRDFPCTNSRTM